MTYAQPPFPPTGGYYWIPQQGANPVMSGSEKPLSLKKRLKQLQKDKQEIEEYIEELKKLSKKDDKDNKDKNGKLNIIQVSMLMLMSASILGFCELYLLKELLK